MTGALLVSAWGSRLAIMWYVKTTKPEALRLPGKGRACCSTGVRNVKDDIDIGVQCRRAAGRRSAS